MDRKNFIRKNLLYLGTIVGLPGAVSVAGKRNEGKPDDCQRSPSETAGPFPNKTPAQLARENIISDRTGVPLLINISVQEQSQGCAPLAGVLVDVWHCDAEG